ncbi:MAG: hypothetical protein QGF94_01625 [Candidatus Thalassarchaeaceae archaeon]|nr:hypothetical protein [Candidatus Thalassarchaeaceae archaeon]
MMRRVFIIALSLCLIVPYATAANAGDNRTINVDGTPMDSIDAPSVSVDGVNFVVQVTLNAEASSNGTTVQWTTQMCLNSGVCNQPEVLNMTGEDSNWTGTVTPVNDHSYVNYDIILNYNDGNNEKFPEGGFTQGGKVWSDCWVSGDESGGENCPDDSGGGLPAPALMTTVIVGLSAALLAKRDD